jgi:hypothetical protein
MRKQRDLETRSLFKIAVIVGLVIIKKRRKEKMTKKNLLLAMLVISVVLVGFYFLINCSMERVEAKIKILQTEKSKNVDFLRCLEISTTANSKKIEELKDSLRVAIRELENEIRKEEIRSAKKNLL